MKKALTMTQNTGTWLVVVGLFLLGIGTAQAATSLDDITYNSLAGDKVEITLHFSSAAPEPGSFTIDDPARIALDLPDTTLNLREKALNIGVGAARNLSAVDAGGRTRVVVNLTKLMPYETQRKGNDIILTIGSAGDNTKASAPASTSTASSPVVRNHLRSLLDLR